ncbi:DUF1847 domain-containing protein [Fundidesulfovibrio butyratiphilus]
MSDEKKPVQSPDAESTAEMSCMQCGVKACYRMAKKLPSFCMTATTDPELIKESLALYREDTLDARMARASAEIEGLYYGKLTRVEEIIAFANRLDMTRIGIASCLGLMDEAKAFARVVAAHGLTPIVVICKVGGADKTELGIDKSFKLPPDRHESMCNPILQAKVLAAHNSELNVVVGLCVGHDSLFFRHSTVPVTTLIAKDRVLGHNPANCLYTLNSYYSRLLRPKKRL